MQLFGSVNRAAQAVGVTRSAVNQWPHELPQRIADRVRGAHVRLAADKLSERIWSKGTTSVGIAALITRQTPLPGSVTDL